MTSSRKRDYRANIPDDCHDAANRVQPPQAVLDERSHRLELNLSPSQRVLGDPPTGYSAWDRVREQRRERRLRWRQSTVHP